MHPRPIITADIIVIRQNQILLIKRKKPPYVGMWALVGGHFDIDFDESIEAAAIRELKEETDIGVSTLEFFNYFDQKNRDPRGRYVDFVFFRNFLDNETLSPVAADDADEVAWFSLSDLPPLAFDHLDIVQKFMIFHKK